MKRMLLTLIIVSALVTGASGQSNDARVLIERFGFRESADPVRTRPGWAPPQKIVTVAPNILMEALREVAPDAEIVGVTSLAAAAAVVSGADIYIGPCTPELLENGDDLEWIQIPSAGIEACSGIPAAAESDILFTNTQRIYGPQIAELVIGMVLSFAKRLPAFRVNQVEERWNLESVVDAIGAGLTELEGKTMLVVGLGGLGTEVAWRANGLRMRVIATRNSRREGPDYVEYVGLACEAVELARRADIVVNTTPLTDETRGMFDLTFFEAMKPTAFFVNVGRGQSVVTDDLVAALRSGTIAGAGVDVTEPEPLPAGHPLWGMPNVIITPHIAASSDAVIGRFRTLVVENVRRYVAGEPLLTVVDVVRGY